MAIALSRNGLAPRLAESARRAAHSATLAAFSLVELLLGLFVVMAIGGAVLAVIPRSLDFSVAVSDRVRLAAAADAFDRSFDRDFAAMVPELGFDGGPDGCAFWTMRPQPDGSFDLRFVNYAVDGKGVRLGVLAPEAFFALAGTNAFTVLPAEGRQALARSPDFARTADEAFATVVAPFRYGGTNLEEAVSIGEWVNPTNAPARVATALEFRRGARQVRLFHRRTRP